MRQVLPGGDGAPVGTLSLSSLVDPWRPGLLAVNRNQGPSPWSERATRESPRESTLSRPCASLGASTSPLFTLLVASMTFLGPSTLSGKHPRVLPPWWCNSVSASGSDARIRPTGCPHSRVQTPSARTPCVRPSDGTPGPTRCHSTRAVNISRTDFRSRRDLPPAGGTPCWTAKRVPTAARRGRPLRQYRAQHVALRRAIHRQPNQDPPPGRLIRRDGRWGQRTVPNGTG